MSEQTIFNENQQEQDQVLTATETIFTGECPSVSGRSTLSFEIGRDPDGSLHLRIVGNSGGGMFCDEWASGSAIDAIVQGSVALRSRSFDALHPGRSINTAGFVLASLRYLGLIRVHAQNTRLHEHVPTETFSKVVMGSIGQVGESPVTAKPGRRKGKSSS